MIPPPTKEPAIPIAMVFMKPPFFTPMILPAIQPDMIPIIYDVSIFISFMMPDSANFSLFFDFGFLSIIPHSIYFVHLTS